MIPGVLTGLKTLQGSSAASAGGAFSGGTLGGINFANYKSMDQNTILIIGAAIVLVFIVVSKK